MNIFSLEGQTALVMGGSGHIGGAVAKGLSDAGAQVIVASRGEAARITIVDHIRSSGGDADHVYMDMADADGVTRTCTDLWDRFDGIDVVVHNSLGSGLQPGSRLDALDASELERDRDVIFSSALAMVQALCPRMVERGGGSIVGFGTPLSGNRVVPGYLAYGMAKAMLGVLLRYVAHEFAPAVRANLVVPMSIDTDGELGKRPQLQALLPSIPAGRFGRSEECVGAAVYLASSAASYVTGQTIVVDGGRT